MQIDHDRATAAGVNSKPAAPGGDYEHLPYLSLPITYSQPAHLAGLAALHGLEPPAADRARVLELGCASGGNLIPLAARFPKARFLGLDLSARQIADGNRRIAAFGLGNIELRQGDIAAFAIEGAPFDYVICHGVYSWVPPAVQDAILKVASASLADHGIAAISYNVLPGWHLRQVVRNILLQHAGSSGTPQSRVAKARAILQQLAGAAKLADPYSQLLRHEAKLLEKMPASYILGEFLAEYNAPCTFRDFHGKAAQHGLTFLCESDLSAPTRQQLTAPALKTVAELSGGDAMATEQYLDMFSGRPFRRSLLIKSNQTTNVSRPIRPERMLPLHLSARLLPDPARSRDGAFAFTDERGQSLATRAAAIGRALTTLSEAFPESVAVQTLAGQGPERARIVRALLDLLMDGRATASTLALETGRSTDARPRAWSLARAEAAAGQPGITSLRHVLVALPKMALAITARLDGRHDREELVNWLAQEIRTGTIEAPEPEASGAPAAEPSRDRALSLAKHHVEATLRHLAACGVLAPPAAPAA